MAITPKSAGIARVIRHLAATRGNLNDATESARYENDFDVVATLERHSPRWIAEAYAQRTSVNVGTTTGYGANISFSDPLFDAFIQFSFPRSILGRLAGAVKVPMNVVVPAGGHTAVGFIGEGTPMPATAGTFTTISVGFAKLAALSVMSLELVKLGRPDVELIIRNDLSGASNRGMDSVFASANVAVANVSPAGIFNGATPVVSGGSTALLVAADLYSVLAAFDTAGVVLQNPAWIMRPRVASYLASLRDTTGSAAFEDITALGGTLLGIPVLTSGSVPYSASGGSIIGCVEASDLFYADDGGMVDLSNEAAVQMDDTPSAGAQSLISLWQNNLVGARVIRFVNWSLRRTGAAQFIDSFQH